MSHVESVFSDDAVAGRAAAPVAPLLMPNLMVHTRSFRHTVDSALLTLRRMGLARRVVLEAAGPGTAVGTVVEQSPAAGTPLTPTTLIRLKVAGVGGFHTLPLALRTVSQTTLDHERGDVRGVRRTAGIDRVLAAIDDQVLKLTRGVRDAGAYLDLQPGRPAVAARYLRDIFGIDPGDWSQERWYALARVLRDLHHLAGRVDGIRTAFAEVFGLEVVDVRLRQCFIPFADDAITRLGARASRLGIDAIAGQGALAEGALLVAFRVPTPAALRAQQAPVPVRDRRLLYSLLLPAHIPAERVSEKWVVGGPENGARLGIVDGFAYLDHGARLVAATAGATS